jgi:hypothetical protein
MQNRGMGVKRNSPGMTIPAQTMILTEENATLARKIRKSLKNPIIILEHFGKQFRGEGEGPGTLPNPHPQPAKRDVRAG